MGKKLMLIINPISGKLKGLSNREALCGHLGKTYEVDTYLTEKRGDGTALTLAHLQDYDVVGGCGGDGTLNEIMTALCTLPPEQRKPLLVIPAGTTNLLGDTLLLPHDVVAAADKAAGGSAQSFDLGMMGEHCFGSVVSFGAFTDSSYATPQKLKNRFGYGAYVLGGARSIFHLKNYPMTVTVNGEQFSDEFIFGGISNCVAVGGIIKFQEGVVQVDDGLYEVVLIRRLKTPAALARVVKAVRKRRYDDCPEIFYCQTSSIRLQADHPLPWTIDGEYKGDFAEADIRILPQALELIR